jgi:acid phosphatase (class A)
MRKLSWLSPFIVVAFFSASPALAENAPAPASDYLAPGQVDLTILLPPPPAPDSAAEKRDEQTILDAQRHRTPAEVARAKAEGEVSVFNFANVFDPNFTKGKLPKLAAFFARVRKAASASVSPAKNYWHRPRPFEINARIHPVAELKDGLLNDDKRTYNPAYPGGHATFGATCAIILSNMVPEKRAELFARGWEIGDDRIIGGVHYPTDSEAGRIDATVLVYAMMQNPQFQSDFGAAKAELRAMLGLAP